MMIDDDILLTEDDIPGASLDGKRPTELNVTQLYVLRGGLLVVVLL